MTTDITQVHLIRHGEVFNPHNILYGRLPGYHLSDLGQRHAQAVADFLAHADLVGVIASPLQRAQETAQPIAKAHGLSVEIDPDLIEASNIFEGKPVSPGDGVWRYPQYWWHLRNPFTPSWGEPYRKIAIRMNNALQRARIRGQGHEIACVSHQLPVWITRQYLIGNTLWHDPRKRQCGLGSVTTFTYQHDVLIGVDYHQPSLS